MYSLYTVFDDDNDADDGGIDDDGPSSLGDTSGVVLLENWGQGQLGQAIKLFQTPRNISFTFHSWHKSFIPDDVKLAELSNNSFEWKNWHFRGVKTYSDPPTYCQGSRPPTRKIYAPG